ncbi:MAG: TrbC/VirB2 family protein [Megasphaera sp.]|uniref:TrbC/VirB2 family protein n=1 Tax=Megasphaera sp. TaxID=2023260 RepID=UPI003F095F96
MNLKARFQKKKAALYEAYLMKVAGLALFVAANPILSFASNVGIEDTASVDQWPWTKFLNSLANQLTGPLPTTLGVLGLAAAAIAMFTGNHGAGTQKFIILIFAVSTCLFAPNFINIISGSAGGATIFGLL